MKRPVTIENVEEALFEIQQHARLCRALALYAGLLTDKQAEVLALYFFEDLGLSEIAEALAISRQAVHDHLKRGVAHLESSEERLHCLAREDALLKALRQIERDCGTRKERKTQQAITHLRAQLLADGLEAERMHQLVSKS